MTVVCESNGAVLIEERGRLLCARCPFACLATMEPCEFDGPCGHVHAPHVPWWRRMVARLRVPYSGREKTSPSPSPGQDA